MCSCAPIGCTYKTYTDKLTYTAVIMAAYYAGISSIPSISNHKFKQLKLPLFVPNNLKTKRTS